MKTMKALLAAMVIVTLVGITGCGGGGGGGMKPVSRSMSVGTSVLTLDARSEYTLRAYWTGDNVADVPASFDAISGGSGMADLWLAADHLTGYAAPKVASGTFDMSVTSTHPVVNPPDPKAGQTEHVSVPVVINPGSAHINPTLRLPEDGKQVLYLYSDTSRASGYSPSLIPPRASTRALRLCPARWADVGGMGTFTPNPSTTAVAPEYRLNTGAVGTTSLTATPLGGNGQEIPGLKVNIAVTIVAHPRFTVSGLSDGDTVDSNRTVTVSAQNTTTTQWQVDAGTKTDYVGSFVIDPSVYTEGAHTIRVFAIGELETVVKSFAITIVHQQPYDPGRAGTYSWSGESVNTNKDGLAKSVSQLSRVTSSVFVSVDQADTVRLFDASMNRTAIASPLGSLGRGTAVANRVWVPCGSQNVIKIYDLAGNLADTISSGTSFWNATTVTETNKVLVSGIGGLREYTTTPPYSYSTVRSEQVIGATGDSKYIWFYTDQLYKVARSGGTPLPLGKHGGPYDILAVPGYNIILIANINTKMVEAIDKDGNALGSYPMPDGGQVQAFGLDYTTNGSVAVYVPSNPSFTAYRGLVQPR